MNPSILTRMLNRVWENGIQFITNSTDSTYGEYCKECGAMSIVEASKGRLHLPKGHKEDCLVGIVEDILTTTSIVTGHIMESIKKDKENVE